MKKQTNIPKSTFKNYYHSLDDAEKVEIRDTILRECGISYPTFYSKLNRENYSILERKAIERICEISFNW